MKILAAVAITAFVVIGFNNTTVPTRTEAMPLVPSKIVDKKKIEPIRVPFESCILNEGTEEATHTLEEHVATCLNKRMWHNVNIEHRELPTI